MKLKLLYILSLHPLQSLHSFCLRGNGNPLSRPVYEGKKHGRYYLTESGKKAYATPTSGGLFHVGIQVDPPNLE